MTTRKTPRQLLLLAGLTAFLTTTSQTGLAGNGSQMFKAQCASCHGPTGGGNADLQAPPLAGLDKDYVVRQLRNFRSRMRGGEAPQGPAATMQAVAMTLQDDASIQALGEHVATLKVSPSRGQSPLPGSRLNEGKALFNVCVACHGSQGEGTPALHAPRLSQLPAWYLTTQLEAFRNGLRGSHAQDQPGQQMRQVAIEALPDTNAVDAVSSYIASLGAKAR